MFANYEYYRYIVSKQVLYVIRTRLAKVELYPEEEI